MRWIVGILCLWIAVDARAEVGHDSYNKWFPITDADWATAPSSEDSHATILYLGQILDDSSKKGNCEQQVYKRVLLHDDEAVEDFTSIEIRIPDNEKLSKLEARTVKPDGTVLELADEDFHEKTILEYGRERIQARVFAFKGVEAGDIVEYRYQRKTKRSAPPLVNVQGSYPTVAVEITWFFEVLPEFDAQTRWQYADYLWQPVYVIGNGRPYLTREEPFPNAEQAEGLFIRLENLPALSSESYAPSYGERTVSFVGHYKYPHRDESQEFWERAAIEIGESLNDFTKKSSSLDAWFATVENLPRDLDADLERCFAFIGESVKCESFLPVRERDANAEIEAKDNVNDLLKEDVALAWDINGLLVAMLDRLGYPSTLYVLRDRTEGPFVKQWASFRQMEFSGVAVRDGDGIRWCYPSAGRGSAQGLPWEFLGCTAVLAQRSSEEEPDPFPVFEMIPMPGPDENRVALDLSLQVGADLVARGRVRHEWACANDVHWVSYIASLDKEEQLDELRGLLFPETVTWTGHDEVCEIDGLTVVFSCSLDVEGVVDEAGDLLLVDLSHLRADDIDIDVEDRQSDVYFDYPMHCQTTVDIRCPDGYLVDEAPPSLNMEEPFAGVQVQSMRAPAAYRMVRDLEIPHAMYYKQAAEPMKEFLEKSYASEKEPVVLVRDTGEAP